MGTHSGEIPFKCAICNKNFSSSNYLETQEKSHSSAQSVTSVFQDQVPWRSMRGPTQERSLSNVQSVTKAWPTQDDFSMIKVWQELLNSWPLEGTWEPTWEKSLSNVQSVTKASRNQTPEQTHSWGKLFTRECRNMVSFMWCLAGLDGQVNHTCWHKSVT